MVWFDNWRIFAVWLIVLPHSCCHWQPKHLARRHDPIFAAPFVVEHLLLNVRKQRAFPSVMREKARRLGIPLVS
jgi:hypothetical protein